MLEDIVTEVNKALETARAGKLIGSSLEAKVYLHSSDNKLAERLRNMYEVRIDSDSLHRIFITSQVEILSTLEDTPTKNIPYSGEYLIQGENKIWIGVSRAEGLKCERCWNFSPHVGSFVDHPTLCKRCYDVIAGHPLPALAAVS
ncbi:putative isoleucine--tRNA ligase [Helianthus debilis subsp. tardiflorus]